MHEFILLPYVHKVDEAAKHSWDIIMAHPFIMHFIRKNPSTYYKRAPLQQRNVANKQPHGHTKRTRTALLSYQKGYRQFSM